MSRKISPADVERVRELLSQGKSQRQVAKESGVSKGTVSSISRGEYQAANLADPLPAMEREIDELIEHKLHEGARAAKYLKANHLRDFRLPYNGPFALMVIGDVHMDNAGCLFGRFLDDMDFSEQHPHFEKALIGDVLDSWPKGGRLASEYSKQTVSFEEAKKMAAHYITKYELLAYVRGNHEAFRDDMIEMIKHKLDQTKTIYGPNEQARIRIIREGNDDVRVWLRHSHKGNSQYLRPFGGQKKAFKGSNFHAHGDGHVHSCGVSEWVQPHSLHRSVNFTVGAYKALDPYAEKGDFDPQNLSPSITLVFDDHEASTGGTGFVQAFWDKHQAAIYLETLRKLRGYD